MFPGKNHDQHDVMDHDHDHETTTGLIKVDNQATFTQEFAKKPTQVYDAMVNVLKQWKTLNVSAKLWKMNSTNEKTMIEKKFLPQFFPPFNEHLNFLIPKNIKRLVKSLNGSNMFFLLNFEPIMTTISQKTWNSIMLSLVWKMLFEHKY